MSEDVREAAAAAAPENGQSEVARLEERLAEKTRELESAAGRIAGLEKELAEANRKVDEGASRFTKAVAGYRALAVKANPGVPEEFINGESIEAIDASIEKAKGLVSRVRQEMEAQASRARVPSGAPPRAPRDLSALTAREKIQHGIGGRK